MPRKPAAAKPKAKDEKTEDRCPHCGYCSHCGRSNFRPYPYYYQPYPQPRWWITSKTGESIPSSREASWTYTTT